MRIKNLLMYSIEHVNNKPLKDLVAEFIEIKTEGALYPVDDELPNELEEAIDNLSFLLNYYYGYNNVHTDF